MITVAGINFIVARYHYQFTTTRVAAASSKAKAPPLDTFSPTHQAPRRNQKCGEREEVPQIGIIVAAAAAFSRIRNSFKVIFKAKIIPLQRTSEEENFKT
jgi:hypothetical protein